MKNQWSRGALVGVVVGIFSLLAAANAYWHPFAFPDEEEYWKLAKNLVESGTLSLNGIDPSAYRPPLVAWILAPVVAVGGQITTVRPLFVVFYAATGALTGYFLCRTFPSSGWVPPSGTAVTLAYPPYFFSAGNLYPQQVLTPLLLAALILVCGKPASTRTTVLRSIAIGAITAVSLLASAPAIFSLAPVFAVLAWEDWQNMRKRAFLQSYRLVLAGVVLALCVLPYMLRNSRNIHQGYYLSLNSGINLLLGNSPRTTPASGISVDLSEYMQGHETDSEFDANRRLTHAAVENIRSSPGHYARLYLRKWLAGFGNTVQTATHGDNRLATLGVHCYMALAWLGVGGLVFGFLSRQEKLGSTAAYDYRIFRTFALLVLASYLLSISGYAIFFTRLRFRIPVDIALAIVSVGGWAVLTARGVSHRLELSRQKRNGSDLQDNRGVHNGR